MSEFKVRVVKIEGVQKHPNADKLEVIKVGEYPVVVRKGQFSPGDKAVYIPVDSIVPLDREEFGFLRTENETTHRVRAKKLRGVFSMGLLIPEKHGHEVGRLVDDVYGVTKWEPSEDVDSDSDFDANYDIVPYYDIEAWRQYPNVLQKGEPVIVTEKIDGSNASYVYSTRYNKFLIKSHNRYIKEDSDNIYTRVLRHEPIKDWCMENPDIVLYGEIAGRKIPGGRTSYNIEKNEQFFIFDIRNLKDMNFVHGFEFLCYLIFSHSKRYQFSIAPCLYHGPWEGIYMTRCKIFGRYTEPPKSFLDGETIMEGMVITANPNRLDPNIGRVKLKYHFEDFLLKQ